MRGYYVEAKNYRKELLVFIIIFIVIATNSLYTEYRQSKREENLRSSIIAGFSEIRKELVRIETGRKELERTVAEFGTVAGAAIETAREIAKLSQYSFGAIDSIESGIADIERIFKRIRTENPGIFQDN
jgi:hypothetical protein